MLVHEKETETRIILNKYWEDLIKDNENLRYSLKSKLAFQFLKKVYKYNMFEKRDGTIANQVLIDEKTIINDNAVHKSIVDALKSIQVNPNFPIYDKPEQFPTLENLTSGGMDDLLRRLWSGKAITTDCVTDDIFKEEFRESVRLIFRDLWNGQNINDFHFHSRIVPLNKMHSKIPMPTRIRPIVINSSIVKLLETRLLPKLQDYLKTKMHRSQIGFVDKMDVYVNIWRSLKRIQEIRDQKKYCYCLFLDFQAAYNTVPHNILFERLEGILDEKEIQLIKAIYSRSRLYLGKESLQPNVGVAQGSVISPALFNIYAPPIQIRRERAQLKRPPWVR